MIFSESSKYTQNKNPNNQQTKNSLLSLTPDQISQITHNATHKTLQTGIDGNIKDNTMTCTWSIAAKDQYPAQEGTIPQGSVTSNSNIAERAGLCFLLKNLDHILTHNKITKAKIELHIDSTQALKYFSLPIEVTCPYKFLIDDYDVISNINFYQKRIENNHQSTIKYSHIYSHFNKKSKRDHILRTKGNKTLQLHLQKITARNLNEAGDKEATLQHTLRNPLTIPLKPQIISMKIKGLTNTTKNLNFIHSVTNSQQFEHYLKNKFK